MNCLSENQLQAYLDSELDQAANLAVKHHLDSCGACKTLYEAMLEINTFSSAAIGDFIGHEAQLSEAHVPSPQTHINPNKGRINSMKAYKRYIASAAAVCLLVAGFTIEPVKAAVSDAVAIFRANDIQSVDISLEDLKALESALSQNEGKIDIENLAKVETKGGESKTVTLPEAQGAVRFKMKALKGLESEKPKEVMLTESSEMTFQLNVEKVNSLMKTLGATKFFSEDLSGKPFSIYTAGTVSMAYEINQGDQSQYIQYVQTKFPEVTAPAGTSVNALTEAIASLGILPPSLQSQIKSMADMNETLYLPNVNGMLEKVKIGGITYFVHFDKEQGYFSSAIWVEDGTVCMLSGNFDRSDFEKMIIGE